jgi:hypothetical protein
VLNSECWIGVRWRDKRWAAVGRRTGRSPRCWWGSAVVVCDRRGNTSPSTPGWGAGDEHRARCGSPTSARAGRRRTRARVLRCHPSGTGRPAPTAAGRVPEPLGEG